MSSSTTRVPSPLPALRAVNQLSSLFQAVLQRSLNSLKASHELSKALWLCGHLGAQSVLKIFQMRYCPLSQKELLLRFFFCHELCFKSLHTCPLLLQVGQQGYVARLVPFCEHKSNERGEGIFHAVIHLVSNVRTNVV